MKHKRQQQQSSKNKQTSDVDSVDEIDEADPESDRADRSVDADDVSKSLGSDDESLHESSSKENEEPKKESRQSDSKEKEGTKIEKQPEKAKESPSADSEAVEERVRKKSFSTASICEKISTCSCSEESKPRKNLSNNSSQSHVSDDCCSPMSRDERNTPGVVDMLTLCPSPQKGRCKGPVKHPSAFESEPFLKKADSQETTNVCGQQQRMNIFNSNLPEEPGFHSRDVAPSFNYNHGTNQAITDSVCSKKKLLQNVEVKPGMRLAGNMAGNIAQQRPLVPQEDDCIEQFSQRLHQQQPPLQQQTYLEAKFVNNPAMTNTPELLKAVAAQRFFNESVSVNAGGQHKSAPKVVVPSGIPNSHWNTQSRQILPKSECVTSAFHPLVVPSTYNRFSSVERVAQKRHKSYSSEGNANIASMIEEDNTSDLRVSLREMCKYAAKSEHDNRSRQISMSGFPTKQEPNYSWVKEPSPSYYYPQAFENGFPGSYSTYERGFYSQSPPDVEANCREGRTKFAEYDQTFTSAETLYDAESNRTDGRLSDPGAFFHSHTQTCQEDSHSRALLPISGRTFLRTVSTEYSHRVCSNFRDDLVASSISPDNSKPVPHVKISQTAGLLSSAQRLLDL